MLHPPKLPSNHPSFIQLEENDDVVREYEEKIMSVCNILTNDQSKQEQEASLKKKLAGKPMAPSLIYTTETASNVVSLL